MSSRLFVIFTTYELCGGGLINKLIREGEQVLVAVIRPEWEGDKYKKPKNKKEEEEFEKKYELIDKMGEGMFQKEWAEKVVANLIKHKKDFIDKTYIIWDYIAGPMFSERLRKEGFKVLGGSKIGYDLEVDRAKTLKLFKEIGYDLPKQIEFGKGKVDEGIKYLQENQDELYAFKSDNTDVATLVAENSNQEIIDKLEAERDLINKAPFLLQEKVEGFEGNCETWYSEGKPILCNVDLEVKKKYNDLSPVQTGCAYDLVFAIPINSEIRKLTNAKMDDFMAKNLPLGRMDLSFIYNPTKKKLYALEVCGDRFGYNQIYTMLSTLQEGAKIGDFLANYIDGNYVYQIKSAVLIINGKKYEGKNHYEALENAKKDGQDVSKVNIERDGLFLTTKGKLLTREEADKQFGFDHSSEVPQLSLFEGFGASIRVFNDSNSGDSLIEFPQGFEDNVWLWGAYEKEGKLYSLPVDSVAILTAKGENPESAFAKVRDVWERFFMNGKYCRDDFNNPDNPNLPIYRYHIFKKLKFI